MVDWPGDVPSLGNGGKLYVIGDSVGFLSDPAVGIAQCAGGYVTQVRILSNHILSYQQSQNVSVSGANSPLILQQYLQFVEPNNAAVLFILATGNGAGSADIPNYDKIIASCQSKGTVVIISTVYPRSGASAFSTAQTRDIHQLNNWIRRLPLTRQGVFVADLDPLMTDPTQATWLPLSGLLRDGVHLSTRGGYVVAAEFTRIITWMCPLIGLVATRTASDVYDAVSNPYGNCAPNPLMLGTSGIIGGGGGTGVLATSMNSNSGFGGATVVYSKGTFADGRPSQVVTVSGTAVGTGQIFGQFYQVMPNFAAFRNGDYIQASAEVALGTQTNFNGLSFNMIVTDGGGTTVYGMASGADILPAGGVSGILQTEPYRINGTVTNCYAFIQYNLLAGAVAGTLQFTSYDLRRINPRI